jgi:hypothetical protein
MMFMPFIQAALPQKKSVPVNTPVIPQRKRA